MRAFKDDWRWFFEACAGYSIETLVIAGVVFAAMRFIGMPLIKRWQLMTRNSVSGIEANARFAA